MGKKSKKAQNGGTEVGESASGQQVRLDSNSGNGSTAGVKSALVQETTIELKPEVVKLAKKRKRDKKDSSTKEESLELPLESIGETKKKKKKKKRKKDKKREADQIETESKTLEGEEMAGSQPSDSKTISTKHESKPITVIKEMKSVGSQTDIQSSLASSLLKTITCEICFDIMTVPHITECGHSYCYSCIHTWAGTDDRKQSCPSCRKSLLTKPALNHTLQNCIAIIVANMPMREKESAMERLAEKEQIFRDLSDPWPMWVSSKPQWIYDEMDDVTRCAACGCEIEDSYCSTCGIYFDDLGDDYTPLHELLQRHGGSFLVDDDEDLIYDEDDESEDDFYELDAHYSGDEQSDGTSPMDSPPPYIDDYSAEPGYTTNYIDINVVSSENDEDTNSNSDRGPRTSRPIMVDSDSDSESN